MRTFTRLFALASLVLFIGGNAIAQNHSQNQEQLKKYESDELYASDCKHDVSGKWIGTEIQYDETGSFIKVKFGFCRVNPVKS